jgi:hypothetical protein
VVDQPETTEAMGANPGRMNQEVGIRIGGIGRDDGGGEEGGGEEGGGTEGGGD